MTTIRLTQRETYNTVAIGLLPFNIEIDFSTSDPGILEKTNGNLFDRGFVGRLLAKIGKEWFREDFQVDKPTPVSVAHFVCGEVERHLSSGHLKITVNPTSWTVGVAESIK